ncbi:MAG: ATP-binding cassette domain-containing protein [Flavobacteriales bacterium]
MDIRIQNLSKRYGDQFAVNDISCQVEKGEILGFLGPNGAGKTTIMKILTGYMAPTSGDVQVDGNSVLEDPDDVKPLIGYLPEDNPLYEDLNVMDYLHYVAALQGVPKERIKERTKEMVIQCGLNSEKHKRIGELSKGFRQRVGLAQALIPDPEILILDEPTSGLDPNQIMEIRELIKRLGQAKTLILSTHILPEVEASCDRILILDQGKIVADGTPESLQQKAKGQEVLTVGIEDAELEEVRKELENVESVSEVEALEANGMARFQVQSRPETSSRKAIFRLCKENDWSLTEMTPHETSLEDVFRGLTSEKAQMERVKENTA